MIKRMHKWMTSSFLILVVSLINIFSLTTNAESSSAEKYNCKKYYTGSKAPSQVKIDGREKWYLHEPTRIGDFSEPYYTPTGKVLELKQAPVTNQCRTSECYLFSVINYVNTNNAHANNYPILISEPYLVAHKFLQHIREGVWYGPTSENVIHDLKGGFSYESVQLIRQVGLVAKKSWSPIVPFENWDMQHLYATLGAKVPEWHKYIRSLANQYGSWDAAPVRQAERDAYESLKPLILNLTGELPRSFELDNNIYTVGEFEQKAGMPRARTLAIDNKPGMGLPSNAKEVLNQAMVQTGGSWKYQEGDYNTIINETVRYLEAGHPVIMDFKWGTDGHSMLVVGYEAQGGFVTRLKVMNSWGPGFGNEGYAWYTLDDVWNNVSRVYKFGAFPQ